MSWTDFFRSHYVRMLEAELSTLRSRHIEEIERLKSSHASEMERAINEANRGWAEADRLRQYLIPGLPATSRVTETSDNTPAKAAEEVETGTPYQRIYKRRLKEIADYELAKQAERTAAAKSQAPVTPAQEN